MNYYSVNLEDHPKNSWVLFEVLKVLPRQPKPPGLPPVFYKFFPAQEVEVRLKPQYQSLICRKCGRFDSDQVFEAGFDGAVTIHFKGDFGYTDDRVFVINGKYHKALLRARIGGFETKPLGKSGWFALRATLRVEHAEKVIKSRKPLCSECGRPKESFGRFEQVRQLAVPTVSSTFFTTTTGWPSAHFCDRALFLTEDALQVLKQDRVKGGYCTRLLTDEEVKKQKQKAREGIPFWRPPKLLVKLDGKG